MTKTLNTTLSMLLNTFELINNTLKNHAEPVLSGYTITEMHCIECIGKIENPNVTKISQSLNITRGGVSKMIKKLINKGAIDTYTRDENKKEVYYILINLGQEVFQAHEKLHQEWNDKDTEFFKQFDKNEIKFALNFLQKYSQHLKDTIKYFERNE